MYALLGLLIVLIAAFLSLFGGKDDSPILRDGSPSTVVTASSDAPSTPTVERTAPVWERPRFQVMKKERERMVRTQMAGYYREDIRNTKVLEAMRQVPRHLFVPKRLKRRAHEDNPLPIGYGQTISQPYIVALMTQVLKIEPGDKVLEIGTGSGYQAAILSELTPHVYTIEILKPLAAQASEKFRKLGYKTIRARRGDGYFGWEEHAPFDAIIVTAAAGHVPPPLVKQLAPGGRMIIPLGGPYQVQRLILVKKSGEGKINSRTLIPVRFVPMTGRVEKK